MLKRADETTASTNERTHGWSIVLAAFADPGFSAFLNLATSIA